MNDDQKQIPLRIQLTLSILSGKPLKIKNIRADADEPGLTGEFIIFAVLKKSFI
jgi:RNA 3'-terminal phosphate cyclase